MKYKAFLISVMVAGLFIGYGAAVKASTAPYDLPQYSRDYNYGYFLDDFDNEGTDVWPPIGGPAACEGGGRALPTWVDTASEFINFVKCKLEDGTQRERIGAAFLIQTMIGSSKLNPPSPSQIAKWEHDVAYSAARGWINWDASGTYRLNSYYQGTGDGANPRDDAFFRESTTHSDSFMIDFRDRDGDIIYRIRRACANPVGAANPIEDAPDFNMSGDSNVSAPGIPAGKNISVPPGTVLTWTHTLTSNASTSPSSINWTTHSQSGVQYGSGNAGTFTGVQTKTANVYTFTAPATIGSVHCRYIRWTPDTELGGTQNSVQACATVVADYDLTPIAQVTSGSTLVQEGDIVEFTYSIANSSSGASPSANCYVRDGADAPVTVPGLACPQSFNGNTTAPPTEVGAETVTIGTESPGTQICRRLYVSPASSTVVTRQSELACVTVAKAPYVHFMGGDVWAGGGFVQADGTCPTNSNAKITTSSKQSPGAGSVVEYAAFALSEITKFGSGSRPLYNSTDFSLAGRSLLFANNTTTLGVFGAPGHCMNDYAAAYEAAPPVSGSANLNNAGGSWHSSGDLTISGTLPAGSRQVYLVDGNVTINNNIHYTGPFPSYANAAAIPSLVVIAKGNIFVDAAVTEMNGLFVARNTFYTCYPKPAPPTVNTCNNLLTVNGAVVAGTLDLYRTRGADGAAPDQRRLPAEIFNLRPELYLNNALNATSSSSVTTSEFRELPPRF